MATQSLRLLISLAWLCLCTTATATIHTFTATLDGPSESPPVASPGTGTSLVVYDSAAHTLAVNIEFSGLVGVTTVAHIHAPTAVAGTGTAGPATQVPTFPGFPAGVQSGTYNAVFDLTLTASFNPAFVTANGGTAAGAEAALFAAMLDGKAYVNVHTNEFPGGEIRGFLARVPDHSTTALLLGASLLTLFALRRRFGS